jgi:lipoic acid synthetase
MHDADLPVPGWLINEIRRAKKKNDLPIHNFISNSLSGHNLNTVCDGARCPNRGSCYSRGIATFMILGGVCTRNCAFCAVSHGRPEDVDYDEPVRVKEAVKNIGLKHVVVTSVTRDDLPDGGAGHFAATISELHTLWPSPSVEVLTPDFQGSHSALDTVIEAKPEIFSHNIETVSRLYPAVRPGASYHCSLNLLAEAVKRARPGTFVKTGFMLGLGEEKPEVAGLIRDLKAAGVTMLTIGQYLSPSLCHYQVRRYAAAEEYKEWADFARNAGFKSVSAGALVRSSYRAGDCYQEVLSSGTALAAD